MLTQQKVVDDDTNDPNTSDAIADNLARFARINAGFVGVNAQRRDMIGWIQLYIHILMPELIEKTCGPKISKKTTLLQIRAFNCPS